MKLTCQECSGRGHITCPDCDGNGERSRRIDLITIPRHDPHYEELVELQRDAQRVIRQCTELKELRPKFSAKYDEQMLAVLEQVDRQAEELSEEKTP